MQRTDTFEGEFQDVNDGGKAHIGRMFVKGEKAATDTDLFDDAFPAVKDGGEAPIGRMFVKPSEPTDIYEDTFPDVTAGGKAPPVPPPVPPVVASGGGSMQMLFNFNRGVDDVSNKWKLSANVGDILELFQYPGPGWVLVKNIGGEIGYIPANYTKAAGPSIPATGLGGDSEWFGGGRKKSKKRKSSKRRKYTKKRKSYKKRSKSSKRR